MILGITGHRPQKLYGFKETHPGNSFVITSIGRFIEKHQPEKVVTGMALGVDQWAAQWCIALNIPFVAMIPTRSQPKAWPEKAQAKYYEILKKAQEVEVTAADDSSLHYSKILQQRNEMIVDASDHMLGVYGGGLGGTKNCLDYAKQKNKKIWIINPGNYYASR